MQAWKHLHFCHVKLQTRLLSFRILFLKTGKSVVGGLFAGSTMDFEEEHWSMNKLLMYDMNDWKGRHVFDKYVSA